MKIEKIIIFVGTIILLSGFALALDVCSIGITSMNKCTCGSGDDCGAGGGSCNCYLTFSGDRSFSNSQLGIVGNLTNHKNTTISFSYQWFLCRCDEKLGDPFRIGSYTCYENWPFSQFFIGDYLNNCVGTGIINVTLTPGQYITISSNISQYMNRTCGLIKEYLHVYEINGNTNCSRSPASGFVGFCNDCSRPICGDGVVDYNEECDDGNNINNDACDNNCKKNIFWFCRQFNCGPGCEGADWLGNEPNEAFPADCITVIVVKEGSYYPRCYPTTCAN